MTDRRLVLMLGLTALIGLASQDLGTFFPELRIYHENQVVNVTCPRDCSPNGNRLAFCIFDNANPTQRDLNTYHLNNKLLVSDQGSDCGDRTSGNGSAFISFRVKRRMSGSTIYCAPTIENCSSLCNTLITPLMINVEAEHRYSSGQDSPTLSSIPLPTPSPSPSPNHITSTPPPTRTKSTENLSSQLPTSSSLSSMPNSTPPITEPGLTTLVIGIAVGVFIAGL